MTRPPSDLERAAMFILGALLADAACKWLLVREFRKEMAGL